MSAQIAKGKLLIALPTLLDPNFRRTVVLLCEHGPEGSLGVVINRPTEIDAASLFEDHSVLTRVGKVYAGGPVAKNSVLLLCRGKEVSDGHPILNDIYLAKDLDALNAFDAIRDDREVRCFVGYAGWSPDQLESEIQSGAWHLVDGDSSLVFDADPVVLWREMIRRVGGKWAIYADMPPDPNQN